MSRDPGVLRAEGLRVVRAGACLLDLDELSVRAGETLALVGPNGAGKSTLLLCLAGLWKPSAGVIRYRGEPIGSGAGSLPYRRRVAVVFQEPLLLATTVFRNVATGLELRGVGRRETERRVMETLERFHIAPLRDRSARTLSGGEAQRASLARAFAVTPEVLFLDEPFAALDPPTREALLDDLGLTLRQTGTTAVFATHDRLEALRLGDRMLVMRSGSVAQIGAPAEVLNHPADEFVAAFVGMDTLLSGRVLEVAGGSFVAEVNGCRVEAVGEVRAGEAVLLGIRPEHVTLTLGAAPEGTSARNLFAARVEKIVAHGPVHKVQLDCGFPLTAFVTQRSLEDLLLSPGAAVFASCKATGIHVLRKG